jgi:hypothetical protein
MIGEKTSFFKDIFLLARLMYHIIEPQLCMPACIFARYISIQDDLISHYKPRAKTFYTKRQKISNYLRYELCMKCVLYCYKIDII